MADTAVTENLDAPSEPTVDSSTEPLSEISDSETYVSSRQENENQHQLGENYRVVSPTPGKGSRVLSPTPQAHPPPKEEYGEQWNWDQEANDYVQIRDGITVLYTEYQKTGTFSSEKEKEEAAKDGYDLVRRSSVGSEQTGGPSRQPTLPKPAPMPPIKEYLEPLDSRFQTVDKPKRFFQVGRIFATVWFEPAGTDLPAVRRAEGDWTSDCPGYHDEKPIAKFRWFIVVRRRLHHSLCFNITTIGPNGVRKVDRGRAMDFVVLHNSNIEPSKPFDTEKITRLPIAVIIEAGEESISPWARLDCGRIYTVEDNLKVMKIGRVHTASLPRLEEYFKESVS
ncbi:hypothetical protein B0H66DRAFT_468054 [Apodospora peruviana]|uniref:DUF6590 domain-containing protein n=1 Tax=Apodospora peruviana TaxID=516989 RepID=A0AAE0MGS6_9PEZI|nr:hypothetical protein B0H66DRAFT_468054 [Apodospora peruviana]